MSDLNALVVFAKVAEANSFSKAAQRLNMPISTASRKVAELEDRLGVRLLERSTRKLRLTEVGTDVLEQALRCVEVTEAVESIVSNRSAQVEGTLRLSAPPNISDSFLAPAISAFQALYPAVKVQVLVTGRHVDHIAEGIDIAFRVGPLKDSSLIARRILRYRHQLVASPDYLSNFTAPEKPADLLQHRLLTFSQWAQENSWTFFNGKKRQTISFQPALAMNDYAGLAKILISGGGIGELPAIVSPWHIQKGHLVEVMPQWRFRTIDLSCVHLGNRHTPTAVRLFKEFAAEIAPKLFTNLPG